MPQLLSGSYNTADALCLLELCNILLLLLSGCYTSAGVRSLLVLLETKLLLFHKVTTLAGAWVLLKLYENYAPPGLMVLKYQLEHFVL